MQPTRALLVIFSFAILVNPNAFAGEQLAARFASPPDSARPWVYWFWLNGNITRVGITADLEAMKRVGIGGVLIMEVDQGAPAGPAGFGSPVWRELFTFMCQEAARCGIEVNMNNDAGWCGSGGPWITPELSMQKLVWTEARIKGGRHVDELLAQPPMVANYYGDVAVYAFPTPPGDEAAYRIDKIAIKSALVPEHLPLRRGNWPTLAPGLLIPRDKVLDLTDHLKNGKLSWDAPAGNWTILRMGHTSTGTDNHPAPEPGRGLESDKLSKKATQVMFDGLMGKLAADVGPLAGKTLISTHIDSWETGSQNWTPLFREEFTRRRGYDPMPWLPVITGRVVGSLETSERFLWDVRMTVNDCLMDNYATPMRELSHQHGMRLSIEAYDMCPCDDLTFAGRADEPMAEFWSWNKYDAGYSCTEMASAAHVYGKPILGAEAFTAHNGERWLSHPANIKSLGDWAFCEGVNRFVFHRYALQPWPDRRPGMSMGPWGLHYERGQTWWEQSVAWHRYLSRCQYLLQQGLFVADVLYLAPEQSPQRWAPPRQGNQHPAANDRPRYNFDGCPADALRTRVSVKDGRLVLPDGMSYRVLALPEVDQMTPGLLAKVKELAEAGATVVAGSPPLRSPSLSNYPACDEQVKRLADALWGDCDGKTITEHRVGHGRLIRGRPVDDVLASMGVRPDFTANARLRYIHKSIGTTDVFFVSNPLDIDVSASCTFRVTGKRPELWWPDNGVNEPAAAYTVGDGAVTIPLRLQPSGSVFVVFPPTEGPAPEPVISFTRDGQPLLAAPAADVANKLTVTRATYGILTDPARTRDVMAKVAAIVESGERSFQVARMAEGDDPAYKEVKTLIVEFTIDGKPGSARATDPETIMLAAVPAPAGEAAAELHRDAAGTLWLDAREPGRYELRTANAAKMIEVPALPAPVDVAGPWRVRFAPGWGAPPEPVIFENLISWSEHADVGIKYFSGAATYAKTVQLPGELSAPGRRVWLDLGNVQVMAEVKVNGHDLGILWRPPYRIDVTDAVRGRRDATLEIKVVNLWVNRQIGDEALPEDSDRNPNGTLKTWPQWLAENKPSPTGRFAFTSWRLWKKGEPLQPSGLIGPVTLRAMQRVEVK